MTEVKYMKKFQKELKTMFRSEDKDFNWGIYRIMNQKNEEITKYIEEELPKIVEEKLSKLKGDFSQTIDENLKKLEQYRYDRILRYILYLHKLNRLVNNNSQKDRLKLR